MYYGRTDVIRLLLFPALMAFAASSDLLTMTISNRLSLALAGGFLLLTVITGMSLHAFGMHIAAAARSYWWLPSFSFRKAGSAGAMPKLAAATALWFGFDHLLDYLIYASLFGGVLTWRSSSFASFRCPPCLPARPGFSPARNRRRRALRHRARSRRAHGLSQNWLDACLGIRTRER